jgi:hypothetical protein
MSEREVRRKVQRSIRRPEQTHRQYTGNSTEQPKQQSQQLAVE